MSRTVLKFAGASLVASVFLVCAKGPSEVHALNRSQAALSDAVALKSNQMAEFAYQTGCYEGYAQACALVADPREKENCLRKGLRECGRQGKAFRSWIERGRARR